MACPDSDVHSLIDLGTDKARAMVDTILTMQAQIISFSQEYQMVMIFTLCAIPLTIMIGSSKAALRKQALPPEHAAIEQPRERFTASARTAWI